MTFSEIAQFISTAAPMDHFSSGTMYLYQDKYIIVRFEGEKVQSIFVGYVSENADWAGLDKIEFISKDGTLKTFILHNETGPAYLSETGKSFVVNGKWIREENLEQEVKKHKLRSKLEGIS